MSKGHKHYPPRFPRFAAGIRSQESRTGGGRSWWALEWARRLEAMGMLGRLGRGKNYALSGQVTKLQIDGNRVRAVVQGTREEPYSVTLDFRSPEGAARSRIVAALGAEPITVARILADDLPVEVDEIFRREGFDLFPGGKLDSEKSGGRRYDMVSECSCPDYANPCKHSAAVLLLLGEEIARNPSALLELRGIRMEELCDED